MKILFANGRSLYPFGVGGDSVSLNIFLKYLSSHGNTCTALGLISYPYSEREQHSLINKFKKHSIKYKITYNLRHFKIKLSSFPPIVLATKISYENHYQSILVTPNFLFHEFKNLVKKLKPDVIITQLDKSEEIIQFSRINRIPYILLNCDVEASTKKLLKSVQKKDKAYFIYNSRYAERVLSRYVHVPAKLIYPPLEKIPLDNKYPWNNSYITMINPVKEKGREVIYEIIKSLPRLKFLLVEGWIVVNDKKYDFSNLPNVIYLSKQIDLHSVYSQTKILLVPSAWNECFGRVAVEAGSYGIPSIASKIGGLPESVGPGGILINKYKKVDQWVKIIQKLYYNEQLYRYLSLSAKEHASQFLISTIGKDIMHICETLLDTSPYADIDK